MQPLTITIAAARDALGLGTTKLYELINEGTLETIKIGRRRLVKVASINRMVDQAGLEERHGAATNR